jgi:predicted transporter
MGCFATIAYGVYLHSEKKSIDVAMLGFIFFVAFFSWTGLLAIFVGYNAKRNR